MQGADRPRDGHLNEVNVNRLPKTLTDPETRGRLRVGIGDDVVVGQALRVLTALQSARYLLAKTVDHYLELDEDEKARFDAEVRREEHQDAYSEASRPPFRGKATGDSGASRPAIPTGSRPL